MKTKMTMIYWKGEKFWLGKLLEHPEMRKEFIRQLMKIRSTDISKSVNQFMSTDKMQFIHVSLYLEYTSVACINVKLPEVCTLQFVNL